MQNIRKNKLGATQSHHKANNGETKEKISDKVMEVLEQFNFFKECCL